MPTGKASASGPNWSFDSDLLRRQAAVIDPEFINARVEPRVGAVERATNERPRAADGGERGQHIGLRHLQHAVGVKGAVTIRGINDADNVQGAIIKRAGRNQMLVPLPTTEKPICTPADELCGVKKRKSWPFVPETFPKSKTRAQFPFAPNVAQNSIVAADEPEMRPPGKLT